MYDCALTDVVVYLSHERHVFQIGCTHFKLSAYVCNGLQTFRMGRIHFKCPNNNSYSSHVTHGRIHGLNPLRAAPYYAFKCKTSKDRNSVQSRSNPSIEIFRVKRKLSPVGRNNPRSAASNGSRDKSLVS